MRDDEIKYKIMFAAKEEFMQNGYLNASMRSIAAKAGLTTGSLYNRFIDKEELFEAIVKEAADELLSYFEGVQKEFAGFDAYQQREEMHSYTKQKVDEMMDIVYRRLDEFKLIICKSSGSRYEFFIDRMVDIETENTVRFIQDLKQAGIPVADVRPDLNHMLASAMFNGIFEVIRHNLPKDEAMTYIHQTFAFFNAGWDVLLGLGEKHNNLE